MSEIWPQMVSHKNGFEFFKSLTFTTFLHQPFKWYRYRLGYLDRLWFDAHYDVLLRSDPWLLIEGFGVLCAGVGAIGISVVRGFKGDLMCQRLALLFAGFVGFNLLVFTFLHFEGRYSLPLRIFLVYAPVLVYAMRSAPEASRTLPPL